MNDEGLTPEEHEELDARLAALGYIEKPGQQEWEPLELLIFGVDGMCPWRMRSSSHWRMWTDQNRGWGVLRSITTKLDGIPHTGPMWTTIYTGVKPEEHGITSGGWLLNHKGIGDVDQEQYPTIWKQLSTKYTVGMMTMPITWPASAVGLSKGSWCVSGFPLPSTQRRMCYPGGLLGRLRADDWEPFLLFYDRAEFLDQAYRARVTAREHERIELIDKLPPVQVLAVGTVFIDNSCHHLFGTDPFNEEIYNTAGRMLATLIERYKPRRWIVVSDHGFAWVGKVHSVCGTIIQAGHWRQTPGRMPPHVVEITDVANIILREMM